MTMIAQRLLRPHPARNFLSVTNGLTHWRPEYVAVFAASSRNFLKLNSRKRCRAGVTVVWTRRIGLVRRLFGGTVTATVSGN